MKFVCLDLKKDRKGAVLGGVFVKTDEDHGLDYVQNGIGMTKYQKAAVGDSNSFVYVPKKIEAVFDNQPFDTDDMTISEYETFSGITITDESGKSSDSFYWKTNGIIEIDSPFWFTILTDSGLIFARPARIGKNKGVVNDSDLIAVSETKKNTAYTEDGNQAFLSGNILKSSDLNADEFNEMARKQNAMANRISFFSSSADLINALDFVIYNGTTYMIVSRNGDVFEAVLIDENTYTSTASTVTEYDSVRAIESDTAATATTATNALSLGGYAASLYLRKAENIEAMDTVADVTSTFPNYGASKTVSYPSGFNSSNCIMIALSVFATDSAWYHLSSLTAARGRLTSSGIYLENASSTIFNGRTVHMILVKV